MSEQFYLTHRLDPTSGIKRKEYIMYSNNQNYTYVVLWTSSIKKGYKIEKGLFDKGAIKTLYRGV